MDMNLDRPITTGTVARLLGVPEPRLQDLLRRGKIHPAPPVQSGRRLWEPHHISAAARIVERSIEGEVDGG